MPHNTAPLSPELSNFCSYPFALHRLTEKVQRKEAEHG